MTDPIVTLHATGTFSDATLRRLALALATHTHYERIAAGLAGMLARARVGAAFMDTAATGLKVGWSSADMTVGTLLTAATAAAELAEIRAAAPTTGAPYAFEYYFPPGCTCHIRDDADWGEHYVPPNTGCPVHTVTW